MPRAETSANTPVSKTPGANPPTWTALFGPFHDGRTGAGLALLRVLTGVAMAIHGWPKIQDPLHWMGGAAVPPAAVLQLWAAVGEFVGGIALALGLLTPVACFGIGTTMAYAVVYHLSKDHGWISPGKGSYEASLGYLVACITFTLAGPGRLSVDAWLFGTPRRPA